MIVFLADAELLEMMDTAKYVDPEGLGEPDGKVSHEVLCNPVPAAKNILHRMSGVPMGLRSLQQCKELYDTGATMVLLRARTINRWLTSYIRPKNENKRNGHLYL